MSQVTVRINGYAYTVGCEDGQEGHLQAMAEAVDRRVDSIKALGQQSGESRLLALAALLMADEIHDLNLAQSDPAQGTGQQSPASRGLSDKLARLADRAEAIATRLEHT
jgi:cell division protein ZapA